MTPPYLSIIDKYYPAGSPLRDIYMAHCRAVASLALELNERLPQPLPREQVEAAAMLHDIGICLTDAPSIECRGELPYIAHGTAGAALLRREGAPEWAALVAERHTGAGLTAREVADGHLPIPVADYLPQSTLERLICYADKFYSKGGGVEALSRRKDFERVRASMARFGRASLERFDALAAEFALTPAG